MSDAQEPSRRRRQRVGRTGARFPRFEDDASPADGHAEDDPSAAEAVPFEAVSFEAVSFEAPDPPDALVGRTGARFNSRGRRQRRAAARTAAEDAAVPRQAPPPDRAPPSGVPLGPVDDDAPTRPIFPPAPEDDPDPDDRVWVRPYVRTRGRTRTRSDLAIETLVSLPSPRPELVDPEHLAIGDICAEPRSVAEVAARVGVPLGVARVLIDDMASAELLRVHTLSVGSSGAPDLSVLKRVLDGLHRL